MQQIGTHLRKIVYQANITERGELMRYFCGELNRVRLRDHLAPVTMPHMGKILEKIPTKDLYYLKTVCDDSKNFSKKFWWLLDPEKHKNSTEI